MRLHLYINNNADMLVVDSLCYLARTHHLIPMCNRVHVCMTRRDNHVMISRSPILVLHRSRA